jgi:hypothetical protein
LWSAEAKQELKIMLAAADAVALETLRERGAIAA